MYRDASSKLLDPPEVGETIFEKFIAWPKEARLGAAQAFDEAIVYSEAIRKGTPMKLLVEKPMPPLEPGELRIMMLNISNSNILQKGEIPEGKKELMRKNQTIYFKNIDVAVFLEVQGEDFEKMEFIELPEHNISFQAIMSGHPIQIQLKII